MNPKIDERIKEEYEAKITGKFKIKIGNKTVAKGKNKWTRYFASSIVEFVITPLTLVRSMDDYSDYNWVCVRGLSRGCTAKAGNDTSTPTSPDTSELVSKIDIAPDTQNVVIFKESDYTEYSSRHTFTWNPGTIPPQTIGEFGVYLLLTSDAWTSPAENPSFARFFGGCVATGRSGPDIMPISSPASRLGARISSGDGDFDPIDYTSEEALILEWYVVIKF